MGCKLDPDIANEIREIARFSKDPMSIHNKATLNIPGYFHATSGLDLLFKRSSDLGSIQPELDSHAYLDASYAHGVED